MAWSAAAIADHAVSTKVMSGDQFNKVTVVREGGFSVPWSGATNLDPADIGELQDV